MIDVSQIAKLYIDGDGIRLLYINGNKVWEKPTVVLNGLAFTAQQANSTIQLTAVGTPDAISLEYSTNNGSTYSAYTVGDTITISSVGKKVLFRAGSGGNTKFGKSENDYHQFVMTGTFTMDGTNLKYLLAQDGQYSGDIQSYAFIKLFLGCSSIVGELRIDGISNPGERAFQRTFHSTNISEFSMTNISGGGSRTFLETCQSCSSLIDAKMEFTTNPSGWYVLNSTFNTCNNLENIDMSTVGSVSGQGLNSFARNCAKLKSVNLKKLSSAGSNAFSNTFNGCTHLELVDFSDATAVPALSNVNAFASTNNTFKIVVPDALYSTWTTASNWSNFASQIVKASEYTPFAT